MVTLLNPVFSLNILSANISWNRLKTYSMIASPKWLTSIDSATQPSCYVPNCIRFQIQTQFHSSQALQCTIDTSRQLMANDPSLRTSNFTSEGERSVKRDVKSISLLFLYYSLQKIAKIFIFMNLAKYIYDYTFQQIINVHCI